MIDLRRLVLIKKVTQTESKIPNISDLITKARFSEKVGKVRNKIRNVSDIVKAKSVDRKRFAAVEK